MRYSEILAVSSVLASTAVAAPQFGIWPFYQPQPAAAAPSPSKPSCSTTVKSSTSSAAASVVASSSVKTSTSSAAVVASTPSSSSSSSSKASVLSTSSSASSSSVAPASTSSSAASSTVVVSTSTSTSSSAYVSPTIVASDDGYNYQFCAIEPFENGVPNGRAFVGDSFSDPAMTVDLCGDFCSNLNYTLFGVEYADECYCGNSFAAGSTLDVNNDCNMACAGDNTEYCGGAGAMNVYEIAGGASIVLPTTYTYTATATATATAAGVGSGSGAAASSTASATPVPAAGGFNYVSCAVEPFEQNGLSYRALQDDSTSSSNMTVAACATYCSGYAYFGVEYSSQCYCGNTIAVGTTQDNTDATCNMACNGDATEQCGGAGRMNLYENSANGGSLVNLPLTYAVPATSTSSVAVPTSSVAAASTTSSVVASSTSSASSSSIAATVSSSSAAVSSVAATTVKTSSSTAVPTTMATSTKSASTTVSASAVATPGVCAPQGSTDLTTCPTLSVGSLFGNAKYTSYYKGTGYTLNPVNPGSLLNKIFPPKVFTFSGAHSMCSAASQCLQQAGLAATLYHNIDLHWQTDSCQWSCTMQQGINTQPSFFNVAKPSTVSHGCGFSGGLW